MAKKQAETLPGRVKFYADENVDMDFINYLRENFKINITSAIELGFSWRDDIFHFQEAKRQKRFLLTCDKDYLNHSRFPFNQMFGVVILDIPPEAPGIGWMAVAIQKEIVPSGKNINHTKIVIHGGTLDIYWMDKTGKVQKQILQF